MKLNLHKLLKLCIVVLSFISINSYAQTAGDCYRLQNQGNDIKYTLSVGVPDSLIMAYDADEDPANGEAAGDSTIWKLDSDDGTSYTFESMLLKGNYIQATTEAHYLTGFKVKLTSDVSEAGTKWTFVANPEGGDIYNIVTDIDDTQKYLHGGDIEEGTTTTRVIRIAEWAGARSKWILLDAECPAENSIDKIIAEPKFNSNIYPNPATGTTTITFEMSTNSVVEVTLYDIQGKLVSEVINDFKTVGSHTITFNATSLSAGVYFYSIKANNMAQNVKFVVAE